LSSLRKGVRGGTIGGIPLCRTCRNATYIQGLAESQRLLFCSEYSGFDNKSPMPFEAYECSEYNDKRLPSRSDMNDVAWILRTNPKQKGTLGFFSPQQLKEFRKKDLIDDED
jgi:hypothetical protein